MKDLQEFLAAHDAGNLLDIACGGGRLEEAITRAHRDAVPAAVESRRDVLLGRARETGVGTPPQLTLVCAFA
mgnify:CR=1 FL=1